MSGSIFIERSDSVKDGSFSIDNSTITPITSNSQSGWGQACVVIYNTAGGGWGPINDIAYDEQRLIILGFLMLQTIESISYFNWRQGFVYDFELYLGSSVEYIRSKARVRNSLYHGQFNPNEGQNTEQIDNLPESQSTQFIAFGVQTHLGEQANIGELKIYDNPNSPTPTSNTGIPSTPTPSTPIFNFFHWNFTPSSYQIPPYAIELDLRSELINGNWSFEVDLLINNAPNSIFSFEYSGSDFYLVGSTGPNYGIISIYLDGNYLDLVIAYSETEQQEVLLYTSSPLININILDSVPYGTHDVRIQFESDDKQFAIQNIYYNHNGNSEINKPTNSGNKSPIGMIIGIILAVIVVVVAIILFIFFIKKWNSANRVVKNDDSDEVDPKMRTMCEP